MTRIVNLSRRKMLKGMAGSGLLLGIQFTGRSQAAGEKDKAAPAGPPANFAPNAYIAIDQNGLVTLTVHRSEMGQGIRTSLAMILADEMAASWPRVTVRQADGDAKYGDQDTNKSRSIRLFYTPIRRAGATARQMLEVAAAQTWHASIRDCRAVDHEVIHIPTGRTLSFGQLAKAASTLPVPSPEKLRLLDASSYRYVGHTIPNIDQVAMLRGKAIFGADVVVPGMRFVSIERCPVYGGKAVSFDPKGALAVHGVERVVEIPAAAMPTAHLPLGGIAVIANNSWSAEQGRKQLKVQWDLGPNATHDSTAYRAELESAVRKPGRVVRSAGNFDAAFALSAKKLTAEYFTPYMAQAMMEPPAAFAEASGGKLLVVAPTQDPQGAKTAIVQFTGVAEGDVTVRPTLLGGGAGRKAMHDFLCEAAWLAKSLGAPVKVTWSREDDLRHDYYHPMCVQRLEGGLDKSGGPIAWRHRTAFPSIAATFQANAVTPDADQLGEGFTDMPYFIPNLRLEAASVPAHIRLGWFRSSMNIPHAFAICSFIDEMAAATGKDPANFIEAYLAGPRKIDFKALQVDYPNYGASVQDYPVDIGRMQSILQLVVDRSGWGEQLLPRQGRGIAVHRSYLSYAAAVALVQVSPEGELAIQRIDIAIDCGITVNPDRVKALMENAVLFGISLTLGSGITVKNGAVEQANFDTYRIARAPMTPEIHVYIVPTSALPAGAADPGVPVIAPAICNAIFAATGKRIRALPIDVTELHG
jgi:isoquinoline 1-oxidoreductase beta subunit